ncbi:carotenoid oxygenase [Xylariaceae sp. FL0016]|nr:carotenoid oxygenase [Xylariaceae sp. FL0016]
MSAEEDFERVAQRMREANFDDWPNEAGFEGLTETRGPIELKVKGSFPAWAAGALYRTGPGEYNIENTPRGTFSTTHWFDGFGHSHKFEIIASPENPDVMRVEYSSRRQSEKYVEAIRRTGRLSVLSFGQRQDPCIGIFGKVMSMFVTDTHPTPTSQNVCVAVHADVPGLRSKAPPKENGANASGHRGDGTGLWITTDAGIMKEMSRDTLEPIGTARQGHLHPLLSGPLSCAHAQRDPETGDFFNYNLQTGRIPTYRVFRTNVANGTTDILATIYQSDIKPAYIHSFFLTPSFVVLCVPSTHLGLMGIKVPWNRNVADGIDPFDESKLCKWFVIDRRGDRGVVATYESPAGFFFHSTNSFEERNESTGDIEVFCECIAYHTTDIIRTFDMDVLLRRDGANQRAWGDEKKNRDRLPRLIRYKLKVSEKPLGKLSQGKVEKVFEIKAPHAGELPSINPNYATRRHRYVYSLPNRGYSTLMDSMAKTDTLTGKATLWDGPKGHTPGEAIFVPRPRAPEDGDKELAEDDGVLLSVILDGFRRKSYLLCLNAKDMREMGRAECDWAVGLGFHGLHTTSSTSRL